MKKYTFDQLVDKAVKATSSQELNCSIKLNVVDDEVWNAYAVNVANRDLMFYTDKGCVTFLVDSYGDNHVAVLHDWERE